MGGHQMTAGELSRMLAARAEDIARQLLPNGKLKGHEWKAGDVHGEAGDSLGVHLSGEKAGVWSDFATGEGGDLLDLIMATNGCDLRSACDQARAMLGISSGEPLRQPRRGYERPARPKCQAPKGPVREYLHGRGLSDATLEAYRIGERGKDIVFPFLRDGELVMAKVREAKDGAAPRPTEANCEPCLFGWQVVSNSAREVILTEGEIDAMSVYEMGFPAMSLPYGGGGGNKQQWIESEYERLAVYDQVYLCLDNDEPGQQAVAEIAKRLGEDRLRVIRIPAPYKDANDLLTKAKFGKAEMANLIMRADHFDPAELISPAQLRDKVLGAGSTADAPGIDLPWPKTHGEFRMRYGETVVVAGVNGHGKTEIVGNITAGALSQGARVCTASYEFLPDRYMTRLVRQMIGVEDPAESAKSEVLDYLEGRMWLVNARGRERATRTLEVFRYAARRYGVRMFVIDNLSKCGIADDDLQAQKDFIDQLSEFAREMDVIVLLVMHMTKGDESRPAGKMQARGTGQITDLVDSMLIVWRNKPKEAAQKVGNTDKDNEPDCKVICEKQRNGESEPMWAFWFHQASHQFVESPQMFARRYGRAAA